MKTARKATRKHTETLEDIAARLRAEYAKHTPEQRKIYGDEPSEGTIAGEWIRAQCNDMTEEERDAAFDRAMAIIYGAAAKSHAKRQTRSKKPLPASVFPHGSIVFDDERIADLKVIPTIDTFPKDL